VGEGDWRQGEEMTANELKQTLGDLVDLLELNRRSVSSELATSLKGIAAVTRNNKQWRQLAAQVLSVTPKQIEDVLDLVDGILEAETKLVNGALTDRLVRGLRGLQKRPLILRAIAALL
jgi:hypothetical protein